MHPASRAVSGNGRGVSLADRLARIQAEINLAANSVGRDPAEITLIAVSKTRTVEEIQALYDLGIRDFGESRLDEALSKIATLPPDVRWHFIGALQSNKARRTAESFDLIHSVASESALREIAKVGGDALIELDLAQESQKSGIGENALDAMMNVALHYGNVRLRGLMTIGPADVPIETTRGIFRRLHDLSERHGLPLLSMGMSADYAVAAQEGATHVRVGTLLFGPRAA